MLITCVQPAAGLLVRLDRGRGRLKETVEGLRVKDAGLLEGLGALHVAACRERLEVCKYLIEELEVDVNGVDKGGQGSSKALIGLGFCACNSCSGVTQETNLCFCFWAIAKEICK